MEAHNDDWKYDFNKIPVNTIGDAIKLIRDGKRVARSVWRDTKKFIYYVDRDADILFRVKNIALDEVSAKDPMNQSRFFAPYIAVSNGLSGIVPWTPTQEELLANDWVVV